MNPFSFKFVVGIISALTLLTLLPQPAHSEASISSLEQIAKASLEDLMNFTVTSPSKIPEELRKVGGPIYVVTNENIRRSGARSVPEVLRMVPGVNVARIDANKWALSIRGFNGRGANKLLVLIDGRTIYDPLFSGTLWETRDVMLEDVDRIEVIRGPGGSTWGANAVNGVINIITKHSKKTQGGLIGAGGGTEERGFGQARYGGQISDRTSYRVYSKYYNRDSGYLPQGASDDSYQGSGGFRIDSKTSRDSEISVQGMAFDGRHDGVTGLNNTLDAHGASLQARWDWQHSEDSRLTVGGFVEDFDGSINILSENRDTFDLNIQEQTRVNNWLKLIAGIQYRSTSDLVRGSPGIELDPSHRNDDLIGASLAGKFALIENELDLNVGTKVEDNDYSGTEVQPDIGLIWTIDNFNTAWATVSKAVRTPSRLESDFIITNPATGILLRGTRDLEAEDLIAYQTGYRALLSESWLLGTAAFYNTYDNLVIFNGSTLGNDANGDTYGGEIWIDWRATDQWNIRTVYSYIDGNFDLDDGVPTTLSGPTTFDGNNPQNQAGIISSLDLSDRLQLDLAIRYVDRLASSHVSDYTVADARIGYRISSEVDISLVAQNLFDRHFEQGGSSASKVEEGVYGKITWRFK